MASVTDIRPPTVFFEDRVWPSEEIAAMAWAWEAALDDLPGAAPAPHALPMASHPEALALFFALSCRSAPVILLPADLEGWRPALPFPRNARLVLPPVLREHRARGEQLGLAVTEMGAPRLASATGTRPFMSTPGFVFFTSGSTGWPRPVYRTTPQVLAAVDGLTAAFPIPPGRHVLATLPADRTFGLQHGVLLAAVADRAVRWVRRFSHQAVLAHFASGQHHYWAGTPVMADLLARCALPASRPTPHPAPPVCAISGRVTAAMGEAFRARFDVPLRQVYGTTETSGIAIDTVPTAQVRSDTAGHVLPGVKVQIGDDPRAPHPRGVVGRVWVAGPGCSQGYGFPPDLDPLPGVDGWWAGPDVGFLDDDDRLHLVGRVDDCIRTAAGYLVSAAVVAGVLEAHAGVTEAVVVPLGSASDPVLAAVIETPDPVAIAGVREHVTRALPAASRPRFIESTRVLPRLPSGKPDRRACIALLEAAGAMRRDG